jgi:hypothetical protein
MMLSEETDRRLIRLGPDDNVLVLATSLAKGQTLKVSGVDVTLIAALTLGHKIAARTIDKGETIVKFGAPIGIATAFVPLGAHAHVHNIRSNYTPGATWKCLESSIMASARSSAFRSSKPGRHSKHGSWFRFISLCR